MNAMSLRAIAVGVACALACPAGAWPERQDLDETLITRLRETVVDVDYDARDLSMVVDELRTTHGLNVHVAWNALRRHGVRKDDRVTVQLNQVPLATVLEMITQELGQQIDVVGYGVRAGVIVIAPAHELKRDSLLRTYDVTDLIGSGYATRRFANTPVLSLELTGREFHGGERPQHQPGGGFGGGGRGRAGSGGGGGGATFADPGDEPLRKSEMELVQELIDLLTESVDPNDWDVNGGETASIRVHDNVLFINHTVEGHRRVEVFLDRLRAARAEPLDGEAIVVRLRSDQASLWRDRLERFPRIDTGELDELLGAVGEQGTLFRAATSGFAGTRMWFSALTQRTVLTGSIPIVGDGGLGFTPVSDVATEGLELILLPLVEPDTSRLRLDVQFAWVPGSAVTPRAIAMATPETSATIDQITQSMRTVSTTARLTLGDALVTTIPGRLSDAGLAAEHEDWLILHVRRTAEPHP